MRFINQTIIQAFSFQTAFVVTVFLTAVAGSPVLADDETIAADAAAATVTILYRRARTSSQR